MKKIVVMAACAVIAAVLYNEHANARHRDRKTQVETISAICTIVPPLDRYAADHGHYPQHDGDTAGLERYLKEYYADCDIANIDSWDRPLRYRSLPGGYVIWSRGADGITEPAWHEQMADSIDSDLVVITGRIVQYPIGGWSSFLGRYPTDFAKPPWNRNDSPPRACAPCHGALMPAVMPRFPSLPQPR